MALKEELRRRGFNQDLERTLSYIASEPLDLALRRLDEAISLLRAVAVRRCETEILPRTCRRMFPTVIDVGLEHINMSLQQISAAYHDREMRDLRFENDELRLSVGYAAKDIDKLKKEANVAYAQGEIFGIGQANDKQIEIHKEETARLQNAVDVSLKIARAATEAGYVEDGKRWEKEIQDALKRPKPPRDKGCLCVGEGECSCGAGDPQCDSSMFLSKEENNETM